MYKINCIYACILLTICLGCNQPEPKNIVTPDKTEPDVAMEKLPSPSSDGEQPSLVLFGTEPFWNLRISEKEIIFTEMGSDTLRFAYQPPLPARNRPPQYLRFYQLSTNGWALVKQAHGNCTDGMSDNTYAFSATVWLNGQLWDGCGRLE